MKRQQIRRQPRRPKTTDALDEIRPGVWMFTPAWAVDRKRRGKST